MQTISKSKFDELISEHGWNGQLGPGLKYHITESAVFAQDMSPYSVPQFMVNFSQYVFGPENDNDDMSDEDKFYAELAKFNGTAYKIQRGDECCFEFNTPEDLTYFMLKFTNER